MGDHFQTIVDLDATAAEASNLAGRAPDWLVREGIVRAERTDCALSPDLIFIRSITGSCRCRSTCAAPRPVGR
ncbi:hypothetical protein [Streptomyces gibsoniae]|uniref:Uncharacterized protein n=1 Tax=Streptomyces gibsoniae TaxID=3075529 RepID=A0ABU2TU19_9ACTN|nr:hypothetical protein [Streptomyces sp. DSM 41699]MDT0464411.1 hypothetical protein [Streptomyces sp. DSM 41699]